MCFDVTSPMLSMLAINSNTGKKKKKKIPNVSRLGTASLQPPSPRLWLLVGCINLATEDCLRATPSEGGL